MTIPAFLIALGGLLGAAGVGLLAMAAHGPHAGPVLQSAALMALVHGVALIALAVAQHTGLLAPGLGRIASLVLAVGVALFSADVAVNAITASRLFPLAAPIGGSLTILAWLAVAVSAVLA